MFGRARSTAGGSHLSPSMAIALLALVVSLGGTAWAVRASGLASAPSARDRITSRRPGSSATGRPTPPMRSRRRSRVSAVRADSVVLCSCRLEPVSSPGRWTCAASPGWSCSGKARARPTSGGVVTARHRRCSSITHGTCASRTSRSHPPGAAGRRSDRERCGMQSEHSTAVLPPMGDLTGASPQSHPARRGSDDVRCARGASGCHGGRQERPPSLRFSCGVRV
jgi:hypothetical protein